MTDTPEQARLRQHLAELRQATHGLGKDFAIEFKTLDQKIARLSSRTAKELKYDMEDIEADFYSLGRSVDRELAALPRNVAAGALAAGSAIGQGATRFAVATAGALETAGKRAKEGGKNALASAAGVNRRPIKEWHTPPSDASGESP